MGRHGETAILAISVLGCRCASRWILFPLEGDMPADSLFIVCVRQSFIKPNPITLHENKTVYFQQTLTLCCGKLPRSSAVNFFPKIQLLSRPTTQQFLTVFVCVVLVFVVS